MCRPSTSRRRPHSPLVRPLTPLTSPTSRVVETNAHGSVTVAQLCLRNAQCCQSSLRAHSTRSRSPTTPTDTRESDSSRISSLLQYTLHYPGFRFLAPMGRPSPLSHLLSPAQCRFHTTTRSTRSPLLPPAASRNLMFRLDLRKHTEG